ncbi:hypothetical protein EYB33_14640 [Lysinibacillus sphaericus]|uniref:hypothetical protein n=1 Tax=Lysinibacillus sphaericus TaxID=1421 RepID=UPI001E510548|nr:hypothetical protein [Lysinibacillus sphaericus]UDK97468.1 hypothetical protein EYB33_14640 [Lysinibacillus sphaericus]
MKKTNIEKLTELREKAYELSKTYPTKIALEFKTLYHEDLQRLKASEDYRESMTQGRVRREDKLRDKYTKLLFESIAEQKAEYAEIYKEATKLAKTLQTTPHAKPSDDLTFKLFEQELQSLQTSTMLGANATRSIEAIDAFIGKYGDDPYFASIIKDNFVQLSQNVLSIEATMQNRQALSRVLERVEQKATSEEQAVAAETLAAFGDGNPTFFIPGLAQHNAISTIIGKRHAEFLDKPTEWLESQEQAE